MHNTGETLCTEFTEARSTDFSMWFRYDRDSIEDAFEDTDIQININDDDIEEEEWSQDSLDDESEDGIPGPDSPASQSSGEISLYSQN